MAKDKEKKVSGEMNEEELANVAGGWCSRGGTVESVRFYEQDGQKWMHIKCKEDGWQHAIRLK